MRRSAIPLAAMLLAVTTACAGAPADDEASKPKKPSSAAPSPTYDRYDCKALLERNYDEDNIHDVSGSPKCVDLPRDEYVELVGEVLKAHADDILEDAGQHTVWDEAWDGTDTDQQDVVCDRLRQDGALVVGQEMAEQSDDTDAADQIEMAQYFLDEKC